MKRIRFNDLPKQNKEFNNSFYITPNCCICGKPATNTCFVSDMVVICNSPLCDDPKCELKHYYTHHGDKFETSIELEKQLGIPVSKIVVARLEYNNIIFPKIMEKLKNYFYFLLATTTESGNIKFYLADVGRSFKTKEDALNYFNEYFKHKDMFSNNKFMFYDETVIFDEEYSPDIMNKFTIEE